MALVVEDGTGKPDAESYVSVTDADAYLAKRGIAGTWAATSGAKEIALIQATDYMEQMYRSAWSGSRVRSTQTLSWPRTGVYVDGFSVPATLVPTEVKVACVQLAQRAVTETLLPDIANSSAGGDIVEQSIGELSVRYSEGTTSSLGRPQYQAIERTLSPFFSNSIPGSGFKVVEVLRA